MKDIFHRKKFDLLWIILPSIILSVMATGKYASLHSSMMDLGLYIHALYNISSFDEYSRILFGSFRPYLLIYSLFWRAPIVFPELILIAQALFLVLPVYFIKRRYGWIAASAYLLYFPLWFNALFDFHVDHLAVPLIAVFFYIQLEVAQAGPR